MTTNNILATEILAHVTPARALAVGDLAVFTDYLNRKIGCKVVRMWAAGEITTDAQVEIKVVGAWIVYKNGAKFTVDAHKVQRAI